MQELKETCGILGFAIAATFKQHRLDPYNAEIYAHVYSCYLHANKDVVRNYNNACERLDADEVDRIITDTYQTVSNGVKTLTVRVDMPYNVLREKMKSLNQSDDFHKREETIRILRDKFPCNENDMQILENAIKSMKPRGGSILGSGTTPEGNAVLIFYIWSF